MRVRKRHMRAAVCVTSCDHAPVQTVYSINAPRVFRLVLRHVLRRRMAGASYQCLITRLV
jgi:hypothetical protein